MGKYCAKCNQPKAIPFLYTFYKSWLSCSNLSATRRQINYLLYVNNTNTHTHKTLCQHYK